MITFIFIAGVRSVILLCCKKETIMSETGETVQVYVVKLRSTVRFPLLFWLVFGFIHFIEYFDDFSFSDF